MLTREFCAENMGLVLTAAAAGWSRIELRDDLVVGGNEIARAR